MPHLPAGGTTDRVPGPAEIRAPAIEAAARAQPPHGRGLRPGRPVDHLGDLERLCGELDLPVLVKGLLTGEDAALAVEHGAAGVVVSNHGGRQLDSVPATIDALEMVEAVAGRIPVLMDGGVRRGTDVAVALALGAEAVLVGRPALWGLAVDGEAGARWALEMLTDGSGSPSPCSAAPTRPLSAQITSSDAGSNESAGTEAP